MTAPRLEINLDKIRHNATTLVESLKLKGISVTGVTKATLGSFEIADVFLESGVHALGDSRIENIESMYRARGPAPMTLIRSPMLSQVQRVVKYADMSFNTELDVIRELSSAARKENRGHGIVLMVELGDLREGVMPRDLGLIVRETLRLPNIVLKGIGTNLACRSGVIPDARNMDELSSLADSIESTFDRSLDIVSGGNSANLQWALGSSSVGRINDVRLGESILLGREPLHRQPIDGLFTDAIVLTAEVIESKVKPSQPWGNIAQTAFGVAAPVTDRGRIAQTIMAIGQQDTDPSGLIPPNGIEILSASSDHLITDSDGRLIPVGTELAFQLNYSALLRSMTSPFVAKVVKTERDNLAASCSQ
ncbi:alanine/ornithine racemase family PLP-dependent enzyme [Mariniblastus sp.]|nr:alanine/ornithine racemase family PLP-dependent enzyme [Mariniblastus sp.]MDB4756989.1 alanine/ornithine racemase family PLP-dependent enzyme [Mariniblastus sp.]